MTIIPLVMSMLIAAVASSDSLRSLGRLGGTAIVFFVAMMSAVAIYTAFLVPPLLSTFDIDAAAAARLREQATAGSQQVATTLRGMGGIAQRIIELVPPNPAKPYTMYFGFYGLGVVGGQPVSTLPEEIGIVVECIGESDEEARAVVATCKQYLLHHGFPGRISTAGNTAFPFTPPELTAGDAYRFSVYHIMNVDALEPLFPVSVETIGG